MTGISNPLHYPTTNRFFRLSTIAAMLLLSLFLRTGAQAQSVLDSFDPNANGNVRVIVVQPDGRILIGGDFTTLSPNGGATIARNRIARLNSDGTVDETFDPNANGDQFAGVYAIAMQADGKVLAGGRFTSIGGEARHSIARLDGATGVADSFDPSPNSDVHSIVVQPDGKILIGGDFSRLSPNGGGMVTRQCIARMNPDGTLDTAFDPFAADSVNALALQPDGKILVGGYFNSIGGQTRHRIARLDGDTGLADAFNPDAGLAGLVYALAVQADGKILLGGQFASVGGQPRNCLARLDGTTGLADSFDPSPNFRVYAFAVQADGKILAGGWFDHIGGQQRQNIARLDPATGLADSFDPHTDGLQADPVRSIAVQADGHILIGGSFTRLSPDGGAQVTRNHIARLRVEAETPTPTPTATASATATATPTVAPTSTPTATVTAATPTPTPTPPSGCSAPSFAVAANFGTGDQPLTVATGDFNADGKLDLAVANYGSNTVSILLGNGTGGFAAAVNFGVGAAPYSVTTGDFNADGKLDLAVANRNSQNVSVLLGDGMGGFAVAVNFSTFLDPVSVTTGDFNADGKLDLATANNGTANVSVLLGNGMGGFAPAVYFSAGSSPDSVTTGDFNADGKLDLAVANVGSDNVSVLLGNGTGGFAAALNFAVGDAPVSVTTGDFNADGKLDLVTANSIPDHVSVLLGNGMGGFAAPVNFAVIDEPNSVTTGDFNADGKLDLATANMNSDNVSVLLGDGMGGFAAPVNFGAGDGAVRITTGDFNADGKLDLAATNVWSDNVSVLLNLCTAPAPSPTPTPTATATPTTTAIPTATVTATATPTTTAIPTATATATATATPTATAIATPTATATVGPSATPSPSPSATPGASPSPSATPVAQAINLSTRMRVQTGDSVGIGGFIITGSAPKHVVLRAIGPSLAQAGVPDALADPVLELHGPAGFVTIINGNWKDNQELTLAATGLAPIDDLEAAIDSTLAPGAYTAIVRGNGNTSGVALVEIYDLSQSALAKLANMSTRAMVGTGDDIVIAGFILGGSPPEAGDRIVVRGIGPSLATVGVANALADPKLELRDSDGAILASNNNWQDDPAQAAELSAANLSPANNLESGLALTLPPGLYTALLSGANNSAGIGLIEVYDRGTP